MDGTLAVAPDRPLSRPAAFAETGEPWPQTVAQFEALVDAVQDELVHFAACRLRNLPDAEDVVQEVLVHAYLERARHSAIARVRPYLYRMVANRCTDLLRKRKRSACAVEPTAPEPQAGRLAEIEALLARLPRRQAEAVRLRVFAGLPFQTIAETAGVSLPTIKSRFRYGVEKLRGILCQEAKR
ncbi:MAG: RNA polymerase sigma factor [Candidatus Sulfopaludibacter sp.]|nr:RNA polymerase sigma factor [Candidatus Sulfopaludibacter sp.]